MFRDESVDPQVLVCTTGKTELRYRLRCIEEFECICRP
ncbi:MAG: DUF6855 family protein [Chloroflexota bacterium]